MLTSAGHADRSNEDFVGSVAGAVALLDGAGIRGTESICRHGVAWYTHRLGGALLGRLSRDDGRDLAAILAESIEDVAEDHRATCDIGDPSSPQATVALVRVVEQQRLDVLVLGDSFVLLHQTAGGIGVVTDGREVAVRRECMAALDGVTPGTPAHDRALEEVIDCFRGRRNRSEGYWIAKDDPRAADEAVRVSLPLADGIGVGLLSNGASRIVDPYQLATWSEVVRMLDCTGPAEVIRRVREAEATTRRSGDDPRADDATVAWVRLGEVLADGRAASMP